MPQYIKRKIQILFSHIRPVIKTGIVLFLIILILRLLFTADYYLKTNNISKAFIKSIFFDTEAPVNKYQGRTNIAIFGMVGGSYEGADLTDTILLLSIDFLKKDAVLISLPRDIWIDSLKDKINSAYHYGEKKQKGGGLILAKSAIEEIVGQPVHYAYLIDLSNFQNLIDLVGGLDIYIDKPFTDNFYPIKGKEDDFCSGDPTYACRYEKLSFEKGWMHMNGEIASKYVRSRQAEGDEGTDFARNKRQQQVMLALKYRLLAYPFWKNPSLVGKLLEVTNNSIVTDMKLSEKTILAKFLLTLKDVNIRKVLIDDGDEKNKIKGFLINPPVWEYKGIWVLVPRSGNFVEIHNYIACKLLNPACLMKP